MATRRSGRSQTPTRRRKNGSSSAAAKPAKPAGKPSHSKRGLSDISGEGFGSEANWEGGCGSGIMDALSPLLLLVPCPIVVVLFVFITNKPELLTLAATGEYMAEHGVSQTLADAFAFVGPFGTVEAWRFLFAFNFLALVLYWWPGKPANGPITAGGHTPKYIDNGVAHAALFTFIFIAGSDAVKEGPLRTACFYKATVMWDNFPGIIGALNIFGLVFCLFLFFKGIYFPSGPDAGRSGKGFIFDYYWGIELYPRIYDVDIKRFVNDRFSMTFWMLAGVSCTFASLEKHGELDWGLFFCALSQFIYLAKFFWWEMGYMRSIDIIVDHAGFYETWGCLVFVPSMYTLHTRLIVLNPSELSFTAAAAIFAFGLAGVLLNFWADTQRQVFRQADGKMKVWGKDPVMVRCSYTAPNSKTGEMETRKSLLLASGWWGIARHFHYVFELTAAYSWGMLAGHKTWLSMAYPVYLTILLLHRAKRDEEKCQAKYGKGYEEYCKLVPYRVIPGIY